MVVSITIQSVLHKKESAMTEDYVATFIGGVNLYKGGRLRTDCPVCEGHNTFSITDFTDCIKYNCFHADCRTSGMVTKGLSAESFSSANRKVIPTKTDFTSTMRRDNFPYTALRYLDTVFCEKAYVDKLADIRYDYKKDRVVFCVTDNSGKVVDGAGRSLRKETRPKWYRYGAEKMPFICGTSDHGVVVEDCASATRIGHLVTGIALLGTHLFEGALSFLTDYSKITIALDRDATVKAFDMISDIRLQVENVNMVILETDIKNIDNDADVRKLLQL